MHTAARCRASGRHPATAQPHKPFADLRASAEAGDATAQRILGGMYVTGVGVPQDDAEALMWLTIAAARSTGVEREKMVTPHAAVASRMTPTDVHEAHPGMRNRAEPPSDTGRKGLSIALGLLFAL